jgi:ankyrin repeat protein
MLDLRPKRGKPQTDLRRRYRAVDSRAPDLVSLLLSKGIDVNVRSCKGETPLFRAARHHDVPMVRILLDAGADPAVRDDLGETALDIMLTLPLVPNDDSERRGREETIKLLSRPITH